MSSKNIDIYGFDELTNEFLKMEKKYPVESERLLAAHGKMLLKRTKEKTPVGKTKKLRGSWRLKPVKYYKGGKVAVVRVQSQAPHAHLVENDHRIVRGGKLTVNSKNGVVGKRGREIKTKRELNVLERAVKGISINGVVKGKKMLERSSKEMESLFLKDADEMLMNLSRSVEL